MLRKNKYLSASLLTLFLLITSTVIIYQVVWAAAAVDGPLFTDLPGSTAASDTQTEALRSRLVSVNFNKLTYMAQNRQAAVDIQLFDDVVLQATHKRTDTFANGGYVWVGTDPTNALSDVSLSVYGDALVGTFNLHDTLYTVRQIKGDVHVIEQRPLDYRIDAEPLVANIMASAAATAETTAVNDSTDDGSVIDVLVVYTPNARNAAGGTNAIQALINLAVAETNTGYDNSDVNFDMRLVHTQEVAYTEHLGAPAGDEFSNALTEITSKTDGVIDQVHALRDTYAADTVAIIIDGSAYCGIAWLMRNESLTFESAAFSVTDWSCATGYYSFGHEIGHNMGSAHDRANADGGAYPYSYGYQDPTGSFRTIMAYYNGCSNSCPRVNHWSNNSVNYNGKPTGVNSNDPSSAANFLSLNNTADTVANFRQAASVATPTPTHTPTNTPTPLPTNTPSPTPIPTSEATIPSSGGSTSTGYLSVDIPAGMVNETIVLHFEPLGIEDLPAGPTEASLGTTEYEFNLYATYLGSGLPVQPNPGTSYAISIVYDDAAIGPLNLVDENTLGLYYWDDVNDIWVLEATSVLDVNLNVIEASPEKFGIWAVFGTGPERIFLPVITAK